MNIETARQGFLAYCGTARSCSLRSLDTYAGHLRRFAEWTGPDAPLENAGARVFAYLGEIRPRLSDESYLQIFALIRAMFCWARDFDHTKAHPFLGLKLPKKRAVRRVFLNRQKVHQLLKSVSRSKHPTAIRDGAVIALFYFTGLRVTEAVSVRVPDLELTARRVRVYGKGGSCEVMALPAKALPFLRRWLAQHPGGEYLFPGNSGGHMGDGTIRQHLADFYAGRAGLAERVTPHALRRSAANILVNEDGAPERVAQDFLRHRHLMTTMRYLDVRQGIAGRYQNQL